MKSFELALFLLFSACFFVKHSKFHLGYISTSPLCDTYGLMLFEKACLPLWSMFIKAQKKWRKSADSLVMVLYTYYRLCESFRGENGYVCQRMIFGLGEQEALHTESERKELPRLLDSMIGRGQYLMSDRQDIYELALFFFCTRDVVRQTGST